MKIFEITDGERHGNDSTYDKCWTGYRKVPGKKRGEKGSCVKEETGPSGADMLAKVDMLLQNTGIKRNGFTLVKDPAAQGSVRGSITQDAIDNIKATLAKAKAMGSAEPSAVKPTMNPADVPNSAFTEDATAGATSSGNIASVANPPAAKQKIKRDKNGVPVAPQKKNPDGTAKNALELSNNLMGGKTIKR